MNPAINNLDFDKYLELKLQIESFADHAEVNLRHVASSSREAERIRTELTLYYASLYVCQDVLGIKEARERGEWRRVNRLYSQAYAMPSSYYYCHSYNIHFRTTSTELNY